MIPDLTAELLELKSRMTELSEREQRLRSTLDHMLEGCQILDHDWRYLYINPAAERQNQRPKEELLGRVYAEMWPGVEQTLVYSRIARCLSERLPFQWENEFEFPDRSIGWFELRIEPVPEGVLILSEDVTTRRRAEEHLRETMANLERSNRDLEQFAYVASHDLQEPLRMVTMYTELLSRRLGPDLDPEIREFLEYAADGAHRMERLIADLLELSRVTTSGEALAPVRTGAAVDEALLLMRVRIAETKAEISHGELPVILGHPTQIVQLFQNLIANSIKFTKPDAAPRVAIDAAPDRDHSGYWQFRIRDEGIGIDPKHLPRLFVIFQRLHPRDKYPGTGIGLALCKRIVERHGGRIWIESAPGAGTTVLFTLPAAPPA